MGACYGHLTTDDRNWMQRGLNAGLSQRRIAQALGRSPSTLCRETLRGRWGASYDAATGGAEARQRRRRRRRKLFDGSALLGEVRRGLLQGWSPQPIAGRLKRMYPQDKTRQVSHETLYAYIYAEPRGELRKSLIQALRQSHKRRLPRSRGQDRRGRLTERVSIHERPAEVQGRQIPGHWEGDLQGGGQPQCGRNPGRAHGALYAVGQDERDRCGGAPRGLFATAGHPARLGVQDPHL